MTELFLGLDIGTSGARGVIVDSTGKPVASAQSSMSDHGSNRRDSALWWKAVITVMGHLREDTDLTSVRSISIDATSGTVLPVDKQGNALADALMYNDVVTNRAVLERISAVAPETSAVHGAASALARTITLQQALPSARLLHQADWIVGQLSGNFTVSDESNALKTGYDPIARCWPDWLPETGVDVSVLPTVLPAGTITGSVSDTCADTLGLSTGTAIVAGMTDGCASFLATGANELGDCVTALGSTITMKMLCNVPLFNPEYGLYSHRIGNRWLAGGASNSGGNVLAHFFDNETLSRLSAQMDISTPTSLSYYPLLVPGERFPHNDADWAPVLEPRPDNDEIFLQAMFEGMASIESTGYQRLIELGAPAVRSVRTVGGGAANVSWTGIRQQIMPVPFYSSISTEAAMGMALFARSVTS